MRATICSDGIVTPAIPSSHLNRCHLVLPRSMESVPSSIFSVSCAVGRRLVSRIAAGTETNSARRLRTVPSWGLERIAAAPIPIRIATINPTTVIVAADDRNVSTEDGLYGAAGAFVATASAGVWYSARATVFTPSMRTVTAMCLSGPARDRYRRRYSLARLDPSSL